MLFVGIGFFILAIIFFSFSLLEKTKKIMRILGVLSIIVGLIFAVSSGAKIIPAGYVGVTTLFGHVDKTPLYSGMRIINPFKNLILMDTRTQSYTMSSAANEGQIQGNDAISVLTADGLKVDLDVTVWYRLDPVQAPNVYKNIGLQYNEKIVRPAIRTSIRNAAVKYKATDIYSTKREVLTEDVYSYINTLLKSNGIICEKVMIRNITLPQEVQNAINAKIAAQQDAEKMIYVLQKEEKEAERKTIEASGIAAYQRIISKNLTKEYLQWKYIESLNSLIQSGKTSTLILPFDTKLTPLLNVK
jgi:regulator of protease activity HflC (stomatin/prohibitin superfamily)